MSPQTCSSGAGLGPLVPVKGTLNASAYQEILDYFMLPTHGNSLGKNGQNAQKHTPKPCGKLGQKS